MLLRSRALFGAVAALAFLGPVLAPTPVAGQSLPDAATLIERHIEVVGGRDAYSSRMAATSTGTFSMPAAGLSGPLVIHTSATGKMRVRIEVATIGEILSGYDGEVAWDMDPIQGPRVLDGAEKAARVEQTQLAALLRDASAYSVRETVEQVERGGEACYRVRLVSNAGRESFDCYSVETGLMVAKEATIETPQGPIASTTLMKDYQSFGDVLVATRTEQSLMGMQQVLTVTEIEFGEPDPSVFELPAPIRALVGGN